MLVPVTRFLRLTKCDFLLALYPALGIMVANRRQVSAGSDKTIDDRGQMTEDPGEIVAAGEFHGASRGQTSQVPGSKFQVKAKNGWF
jgi:hypothetical protein